MTTHPAALRQYTWHATQAETMALALAGLVASGAAAHLVDSQRAALFDQLAKLEAAHVAVQRRLCGA